MTNRKLQNIIAAVVIVMALYALFSTKKIETYWENMKSDPRPEIAEIENFTNTVKYRPPESLSYHDVQPNQPLHAKDTVATDPNSTAVISFKSGLKVELEPNSLMIVEDYGGASGGASGGNNMELTFLRGNVKILNQAAGIKLTGVEPLTRNEAKKIQPTLKIDLAFLEHAPAPKPPPVAVPKINLNDIQEKEARKPTPPPKKPVVEKETLPESFITSVIKNQRTFLNRCYAQHLRLNPDARGRINTMLTIEPDGTISTARVVGSTIADPALQQCVVTTLQRARFRPFNGDPIIVEYPINFE